MSNANSNYFTARVRFIYFIGIMIWLIMVINLFRIQLILGDTYEKKAINQHQRKRKISSERGLIFDRNFNALAVNLPSTSIYIDPEEIENPKEVAAELSAITNSNYKELYNLIKDAKGNFAWVLRKIPADIAQIIEKAQLKGVHSIPEIKRYYPYKKNGSAIIGFTGIDNQGLGGIECKFEEILKGKEGIALFEKDAKGGGRYCFDGNYYIRPQKGLSVRLTIDSFYQEIVQQELRKAYQESEAKSCSMIIMNPKTGEILAMATEPSFDPNLGTEVEPRLHKNRAISDVFEPGSTYKIVTAAAALEEHKLTTSDIVDCGNGEITIADRVIHDYRPYTTLTFRQVIEKSSNIGVINIAQKLGKNKLYEYGRSFGFGMKTNIDLPGESEGIYRTPNKWTSVSVASISIGQEISTTALQLANAFCAIANNGVLMQPIIVKEVIDEKGRIKHTNSPQVIRRVVSKATADTLTSILVGVVEKGTGIKAKIDGITVAGKTGTAQKSDLIKGGYALGKYTASFAGFLPADDPQLVALVIINEPQKPFFYYGGDVAAPVFKRVMEKIICLDSTIIPTQKVLSESNINNVPDVRGLPYDIAVQTIRKFGFIPKITGEGAIVIAQQHLPNTLAEIGSTVKLTLTPNPKELNVIGMPLRKAYQRLSNLGFEVVIDGSGIVRQQTKLADKNGYRLTCQ